MGRVRFSESMDGRGDISKLAVIACSWVCRPSHFWKPDSVDALVGLLFRTFSLILLAADNQSVFS